MRGVRNLGEIQGSNFSSIAGFGFNDPGAYEESLLAEASVVGSGGVGLEVVDLILDGIAF